MDSNLNMWNLFHFGRCGNIFRAQRYYDLLRTYEIMHVFYLWTSDEFLVHNSNTSNFCDCMNKCKINTNNIHVNKILLLLTTHFDTSLTSQIPEQMLNPAWDSHVTNSDESKWLQYDWKITHDWLLNAWQLWKLIIQWWLNEIMATDDYRYG